MSQSEAGKGDGYRKVDQKTYGDNYDRIFGKKTKKISSTEELIEEFGSPDGELEKNRLEIMATSAACNHRIK